MELLISRHESSGMTLKDFCKVEEVSKSTFEYWRRKLRVKSEEKATGFQQIMPFKKELTGQIRLLTSTGITIEFPSTYPAVDLLKIIDGISC